MINKKLNPFKLCVLQNFPYIEADFDALTNYELLCKVVEYLNKTIDAQNEVITEVGQLHNAFLQLKDFVDNYFDNLDVQDEINNKLDKMAEDGTLQEIISSYINTHAVLGYNTISDLKSAVNLVDGSFVKTLGGTLLNDGKGATYKIRIKNSQDIDGNNVVFLSNENLVAEKIEENIITNFEQFKKAILTGGNYGYLCGKEEIVITESTLITASNQLNSISFVGATFNLQTEMFNFASNVPYADIPNFVNCTFIGNGNAICNEDLYLLNGKFVNCNFKDCSIIQNGKFVQSFRFINCLVNNSVNNTFIDTKRIYECRFYGLQCESGNKAKIISATSTITNQSTVSQLSFDSCVLEGQTNEIVRMHDGNVSFNNMYLEANSQPLVNVLPTNRTANGIIRISITNSGINHNANVNTINIDDSYANSIWSVFVCKNCSISVCNLINDINLKHKEVTDCIVDSGGKIPATLENSKVGTANKNSIVEFTSTTQFKVKKFPALITIDSNTGGGGYKSFLYFVSLSYGNKATVKCLSHPDILPTAEYDSSTGYVTVTSGITSDVSTNKAGILLTGIINNLNPHDVYQLTDGYNV